MVEAKWKSTKQYVKNTVYNVFIFKASYETYKYTKK